MKKIISFVLGFCSIEMVLAMPDSIFIEEGSVSGTVKVDYGKFRYNIKKGGNVDFIGSEIGIKGSWNGSIFALSSRDKFDQLMTVTSVGVPVVFNSFLSSQCDVYAPFVGILGNTQIDSLNVSSNKKNLQELLESKDALLDIRGGLSTKFLNVYGSVVIGLSGAIDLQKDGKLRLCGSGVNDYLGILGTLSSKGNLDIETTANSLAKVINSGNITSDTGEVIVKTERFINNKKGKIVGNKASFQIDTLIENYGIIDFEEFNVVLPEGLVSGAKLGWNTVQLLQYGAFMVRNLATLACNVESMGWTAVHRLVFPYVSGLKVIGGKTLMNRVSRKISSEISGRNSWIDVEDGAIVKIGCLEDEANFIESRGEGSELIIAKLDSNKKSMFTAKSGGKLIIGEAQVPESFMYSDDGSLDFSKLEGKSLAFVKGTAKLNMSEATDFSLVSNESAETQVKQSVVKEAYLLGNKKSTFMGTTVESLNNRGKFTAEDTHIKFVENDNKISFVGNTLTDKLSNSGETTFESGKHHVGSYVGRSLNGAIKAGAKGQIADSVRTLVALSEGRESLDTVIKAEKQDQVSEEFEKLLDLEKNAILQTDSSLITIDNLEGTGNIEAFRQIYNKKLPTRFRTSGNVLAVLDYMPCPNEVPIHDSGDFLILSDMKTDYVNNTDANYTDVLLFMQMNGHVWENRHAKFIAGGLKVNDASSWGNIEGFVGLERLWSVDAEKILNVSEPIARNNGRWVDTKYEGYHIFSFGYDERTRLIYYCPATYYLPKLNTGVVVMSGDIKLKSKTDILNRFSTIYSGGNFKAEADVLFKNEVGTILVLGQGDSYIVAPDVENNCLPIAIRKGEATTSGSSEDLFSSEEWYAHHETREEVTQSPGSKIFVEGNFKIDGKVENIGSELLSGKLFSGDVNSRSVLENTAIHGSKGSAIEGNILRSDASLVFTYRDKLGCHKNNSEGKQVFDMKNK